MNTGNANGEDVTSDCAELAKKYSDLKVRIGQGYGMSECSPVISEPVLCSPKSKPQPCLHRKAVLALSQISLT